MAKVIRNNHDAKAYIEARADFTNSRRTFSGDIVSTVGGGWPHPLRYTGYLPKGFHDSLARADYVVFSYSTPIGWHIPREGWVVPEVTYSATTSSRHQPILRSAVWNDLAVRPSWVTIAAANNGESSPTAAEILRSIRAGYRVPAERRTRRTIELIENTGEAVVSSDGRYFEPITKEA